MSETAISQQCRFYALTGEFPGSGRGGHLRPTPDQIQEHRPVLIDLLQDYRPDIVVPVGAMAISQVMPEVAGSLTDVIGTSYTLDPFNSLGRVITVIPLPHPSGRSTWLQQHSDLLETALTTLTQNLG